MEMSDGELAGYILEKFESPDSVIKRGKNGELVSESLPPPTLQGICFELRMTAAEFEKRCAGSVELQRVVELCFQKEYDLVFRGGLSGELNGGFAALVMKNRHDWKEKAESRVTNVLPEIDEATAVRFLEFMARRGREGGLPQVIGVRERSNRTEELI